VKQSRRLACGTLRYERLRAVYAGVHGAYPVLRLARRGITSCSKPTIPLSHDGDANQGADLPRLR